ncbi:ABC transporter substrate-binding protein [Spirochaeta dissipatitropha]
MKKVLVLMAAIALLSTPVLFAGGQQDAAGGDVTLTFWAWSGSIDQQAVAEYNAQTPGVTVDLQLIEQGDLHENLLVSFVGGSGAPDITGIEIAYVQQFLENPQHFVNLFDMGAQDIKSDYLDWKFEQAMTPDGNHLIGLPIDIGPMAMAYRVDVFEAAGLPTDPDEVAELFSTWESYLEVGRIIKEETGRYLFSRTKELFDAVANQAPFRYFDADGNLIVESNPQIQRAWELAIAAHEAGLSANINAWTSDWAAAHNDGAYATEFAPSWMVRFLRENSPDARGQWAITEAFPGGGGNWGGSFLGIPAQSRHKQEAYDFIKWMLAPEQQKTAFQREALFPSTPAIYDDPAITGWTDDFFATPNIGEIYTRTTDAVIAQYLGPNHSILHDQMEAALGRVEDGVETPAQAWASAIAESRRQLDR